MVFTLGEVLSWHESCTYLKPQIVGLRVQRASLAGICKCCVKTDIWMLSVSSVVWASVVAVSVKESQVPGRTERLE